MQKKKEGEKRRKNKCWNSHNVQGVDMTFSSIQRSLIRIISVSIVVYQIISEKSE